MNTTKNDYLTSDKILKLFSDDEVSAVCTAETADRLSAGDEFIDLEKFDLGVQRGPRSDTPMGHVLPKKISAFGHVEKIVAQFLPNPCVDTTAPVGGVLLARNERQWLSA